MNMENVLPLTSIRVIDPMAPPEDGKEGPRAFGEKRKPVFQGR